jgi:hypothetical protein
VRGKKETPVLDGSIVQLNLGWRCTAGPPYLSRTRPAYRLAVFALPAILRAFAQAAKAVRAARVARH